MPSEQKYDPALRDAATTRVQERLFTNPGDRSVFRVVSDEFGVGEQSLRAWVKAASPDIAPPERKRRRPRFSPVVTTTTRASDTTTRASGTTLDERTPPTELRSERTVEASPEPVSTPAVPVEAPAQVAGHSIGELEAEAAALQQGNDALKTAMRVLLSD